MVITIPHLGNVYIAAKALFEELKIPYVIPAPNNQATLQTGINNSPDEICLPFKVMLGNFLECINKGADTILITGSCGPCRFGEYCELQMKILKRLGHQLEFIVIDSPSEIGRHELLQRIGKLSGQSKIRPLKKLNALRIAFKILDKIDKIDAKAHFLSGYEVNKGECKELLKNCKTDVFECNTSIETFKKLYEYEKKIDTVEVDMEKQPIKVALIGEIYSMIEPFSNLYIEEKLMDYGVSSTRLLTPSWWFKDLILKAFHLNSLSLKKAAKDYLSFNVGGHARETIGEAVLSKNQKADGAIQIFPLGCMPEIVAKSVLPTVSKNTELPIMTLIIDEMSSETGYNTRIEAFLDMLEAKRKGDKNGKRI